MAGPHLSEDISPTVFDQLLKPIIPIVEESAKALLSHHNEAYKFQEFFRLLAFYFVIGKTSIASLIKDLNKDLFAPELALRPVARSTFKDGFERFDSLLFKTIFTTLLSGIGLAGIPELNALGTLYCVDGSLFPVLNTMLWAEYRQSCRAVRLHLCFELNRMIAVDILVGSGKSSERQALRGMLKASVTYIADRGYQCFQLFHEIAQAQAYFVIRVKNNLQYTIEESLPTQFPEKFDRVFSRITDQIVRGDNDSHQHSYRLVRFCVLNEWFSIMTNRLDLTTFQVILLYAYRWQVELIFRFLKRTMNGIHIINHSENGITIQFYMMLIVAMLQLKLKQQLWKENKEEKRAASKKQQKNVIEEASQFFESITQNFKSFWKVGIHWLNALRAVPRWTFNGRAIEILQSD